LQQLPLEQLQRGRYQPRRDMNPVALQELADSIKAQGDYATDCGARLNWLMIVLRLLQVSGVGVRHKWQV
jgi:hypothetical protein